ncbi:TfoX/Sxy family protein [Cocleimonas sp. KMM 6892]|uniref:TfoX/Sxy family protein n=1 Tax=unclassified Cocleimonas TaxID=2639732 RepID=UPI002DB70965|nr:MULTISPECIES: TfoX/Sxy family protein [unclassified Cocleimonas]MEB8433824.1 TfoX/Sxy family protein [Cocleimonas sp. KMM 6892]MEC4716635.1 TfoX/Sxy family protein [Cocleimonas sp. KMM 6895]MEC4746210.1 TfoX/Sxy family protein [Cocleimonas sp. KMM 6896]
MSVSAEYLAYIQDLLCDVPDVSVKAFFGGKSLRSRYRVSPEGEYQEQLEEIQFAMIIDDVLYFVVDDQSRPKYETLGMTPFEYEKKTGAVKVRKYYTAPESCFEDQDVMHEWAKEALQAASRSQ